MTPTPLVCLSHVGWSSGAGHPGQLMSCFARHRDVYVLEPAAAHARLPLLGSARNGAVTVLTPYLPTGLPHGDEPQILAPLLDALLESQGVTLPILWVCNAQALAVTRGLPTSAVVYDCPRGLEYDHDRARAAAEAALLRTADLVVVHDDRDAARLRGRHPLVHAVHDGDADLPQASGATVRLLDDLLRTLVAVRTRATPAGVPVRTTRPHA